MLKVALLVVLAALACRGDSEYIDSGRLYRSVIIGDFTAAISISKNYRYRGTVIEEVVKKLIDDSQYKILDYAHALWNGDAQDIVRNYFPVEIRSIIGQHNVKIIGKRDNMVLKLDANIDSMGDRIAFGDSNHMIGDRMAWKFIPVLDNRLYFQIYNPHTNQYLKLGGSKDSDGDYQAFGDSRSGSYRHQFFLVPVKFDDELLFYIFNREYQQALKYSRAVDSYGDRTVYGENGNVIGEPESFGWLFQPY